MLSQGWLALRKYHALSTRVHISNRAWGLASETGAAS